MRARSLLLGSLALVFAFFSMASSAQDIARWVDEKGVTHFGNPQFAPEKNAGVTLVKVHPTNGMDVPEVANAQASARPRIMVVKKKAKSNPRGWQGYQRNKYGNNKGKRNSR